jgi:hypothetical protein
MIDDARLLLAAWRERLVSDAEVIAWADRMLERVPVSDLPSWLLDLSVEGPARCMSRAASEFLEVSNLSFCDSFMIRARRLDLDAADELDDFVKWTSGACMGEDLEQPEVRLGYQLDHLACDCDRPADARALARAELPALRKRVNVTADRLARLIG